MFPQNISYNNILNIDTAFSGTFCIVSALDLLSWSGTLQIPRELAWIYPEAQPLSAGDMAPPSQCHDRKKKFTYGPKILPVVLCSHEIWETSDNNRDRGYMEQCADGETYGPTARKWQEGGGFSMLMDFVCIHSWPDIISINKSRNVRCVGRVARMREIRNAYRKFKW